MDRLVPFWLLANIKSNHDGPLLPIIKDCWPSPAISLTITSYPWKSKTIMSIIQHHYSSKKHQPHPATIDITTIRQEFTISLSSKSPGLLFRGATLQICCPNAPMCRILWKIQIVPNHSNVFDFLNVLVSFDLLECFGFFRTFGMFWNWLDCFDLL